MHGLNPVCLDDIGKLASDLMPVSSDWFELGMALGVSTGKLKEIEETYKKSSRCMIEMLQAWIKKGGNRTHCQIIEALRGPLVDNSDLADKLEKIYQ